MKQDQMWSRNLIWTESNEWTVDLTNPHMTIPQGPYWPWDRGLAGMSVLTSTRSLDMLVYMFLYMFTGL